MRPFRVVPREAKAGPLVILSPDAIGTKNLTSAQACAERSRRGKFRLTNLTSDSRLGLVTISGKLSNDVGRGTLNSILKQAGLKGVGRDV